jgi:CheY-like chemotaxis protein
MTTPDLLRGRRVIIAEDEPMLSLVLCDMLHGFGCTVVGTAGRMGEALQISAQLDYEIAVLDTMLHKQSIERAAHAVVARKKALVFVTGYGKDTIPIAAGLQHWPVVEKPYTEAQLRSGLERAVAINASTHPAGS